MKKILLVAVVLAALLPNIIYVSNTVNDFKNSEELVVSLMQAGIGSKCENTISDSIYGHDFTATYKAVDNSIVRTIDWE